MKLLSRVKISVEIFSISLALSYGYYFHFVGGKDISYWARYNYKNGDLYLSYIHAIVAFFTILFIFSVFRSIFSQVLSDIISRFASANKKQNGMITQFVVRLLFLLQYIGAILMALYFIKENYITRDWINHSRTILCTILLVYISSGTVRILLEKKFQGMAAQKSSNASVLRFANKVFFILFWIFGLAFILSQFGYNVNALFAGAGIGGLAIALAAQKSLTNIFGAVTLLLNKPFQIGDYISINMQEGTVKDIGLTYVTLTDRLGHQVMIPNESIITTSIANFSVRESRRVDFIIGVTYSTSLEKVKLGVELIENLLKTYLEKSSISEDIRVTFDMFNAFSLDIKVTYFSLEKTLSAFNHQKQEINLEIKKIFSEAEIDMAFPTSEMIIKSETPQKNILKSPVKKEVK